MTNYEFLKQSENNQKLVKCDYIHNGKRINCVASLVSKKAYNKENKAVKLYNIEDETGDSDFFVGVDEFNSKNFDNLETD